MFLQRSALDELNSPIPVKHEELKHMTFLVDEKDIEIAEARSSLQENELKQLKMTEKSRRDEQRLYELEKRVEWCKWKSYKANEWSWTGRWKDIGV